MCSPTSVSDAGVGFECLVRIWFGLPDELLQFRNFADFLKREDFVFPITIDS